MRAMPDEVTRFATQLVETSSVAQLVLTSELVCLYANAAAASLGGLSQEATTNRSLHDLYPRLAGRLEPLLRMTSDSGSAFSSIDLVSDPSEPGGQARRWIVSTAHLETGTEPCLGLTILDLPLPSEVHAASQERDELFREIFERTPTPMMVLEWRGQAFRMNPAFLSMVGYTEEEFSKVGVQGITHPDDFAADLERFGRMMKGEIDGYEIVKRFVRKDGVIVWGHLSISIARKASGEPTLIISSANDITARKQAEDERDRLIKQLEEAVRLREVFLSVAAHELKTPLTPLQLDLQLFQRKHEKANEPMPAELARAMRQTARLATLVETLLDISRLRAGHLVLACEAVDLAQMVRDVVDRLVPEAAAAGCALSAHADTEVVAKVDPIRIEQVLSNLVANAIKFGAQKPIDVSVGVAGEGAKVRLSVRDQGIGIAQDDQARIFGRFERAVSDMHYGGLGLGLYIAKEIVEAHHGEMTIQSEFGKGAEFVVELPVFPVQA